jgi:hypothetical protein
LAPTVVGKAGDRHLVDPRAQRQHRLDVDRRDVFAAADDHVVDATGDEEIAIGVDITRIAGEVPAVAQALGIGVGSSVVALESLVSGQVGNDLALLADAGRLIR